MISCRCSNYPIWFFFIGQIKNFVKALVEPGPLARLKLKNSFKNIVFNGSQSQKLPGVISISFLGSSSDILLIQLDREEVYVSNGSACGSGIVKPSHVLSAIGLDERTNLLHYDLVLVTIII